MSLFCTQIFILRSNLFKLTLSFLLTFIASLIFAQGFGSEKLYFGSDVFLAQLDKKKRFKTKCQ